ncbi:hypothetical protein [Mariniblastus fucicola]|uniref:Uncharacterized protein n=1 Tax=Mariniblastus fucicola TaxID=980251 RepID=A0A5B9PGR4_9BACT|nr:hypothetical protein [Mariniblastus fucicola]QEG21943.1 hypothetical protein MFFC18_18040 [Mariniblastus fucicola]
MLDNKALNRSGEGFVVGLSPDGRKLPLYPTPFSLIHITWSARLTRTLSNNGWSRRTPVCVETPLKELANMNFSVWQLFGLVSHIAIGMLVFPLIINAANRVSMGQEVPEHAATLLAVAGGILGAFIYLNCIAVTPFLNRKYGPGVSACEKCGRKNAITSLICPRCESKIDH